MTDPKHPHADALKRLRDVAAQLATTADELEFPRKWPANLLACARIAQAIQSLAAIDHELIRAALWGMADVVNRPTPPISAPIANRVSTVQRRRQRNRGFASLAIGQTWEGIAADGTPTRLRIIHELDDQRIRLADDGPAGAGVFVTMTTHELREWADRTDAVPVPATIATDQDPKP